MISFPESSSEVKIPVTFTHPHHSSMPKQLNFAFLNAAITTRADRQAPKQQTIQLQDPVVHAHHFPEVVLPVVIHTHTLQRI